ncbi:hypothetical protein LTR86_006666 [Recurvomyces mirabilis]|nr:hypothetical protein LTR86_006666 [Recurvomyces mirabilis]
MDLPPLAPIPPFEIRLDIVPTEWEACLDAWLTLTDSYLQLGKKHFATAAGDRSALGPFLISTYGEIVAAPLADSSLSNDRARKLQRSCFMLIDRMIAEGVFPKALLSLEFLEDFCHAHVRSTAASRLVRTLWLGNTGHLQQSLQKRKTSLAAALESTSSSQALPKLTRLAPLFRLCPDIGTFFLTGSDFLDGLATAYTKLLNDGSKKSLSSVTYLGLASLVKTEHPNFSLLSDCLYDLKARADKQAGVPSLLADVVTNTPLLSLLRRSIGEGGLARLAKLIEQLETYRMPSIAREKRVARHRSRKGKIRQSNGDMHIHQMSLVTQVQDLFPDLGSGFVMRLLDEYHDDVEQVTAHLLDDSLPQHLQSLDRTEEAILRASDEQEEIDHLAPRSTPPPPEPFVPDRRNVFDDDDLLSADASRLHLGKADRSESGPANKAAILSALSAFDADDDERDDTYDVDDVGGTVDSAHPDGEPGPSAKITQEENDMALFRVYRSSPERFGRTFDIRRGQARMALKGETGMTDEAIEGWAIMLQREPKRLQRLETRFGAAAAFDGRQTELGRTSYRESPGGTETEDSDGPSVGRGGYRGRGRGGRGRGGGRGGSVAGPSGEASTANAQRRKEASKGSRANHNRRDQRAKKIARGGFPG